MTMTLLQLQVVNWWSFSYIISANLFALLFHFLLINNVRMTTFTHQLLARKNINPRSLTMRVRIFQPQCYGVSRGVAHVLSRSRFIQPRGKLDTMWRGAWQRLATRDKTRHQGEMWPLQMVTVSWRHSLSHRKKHRNLHRENLQFTEPNIFSTDEQPGFEHG